MTTRDRQLLVEAVRGWAKSHPSPDRPVLSTSGFHLSPNEIGQQIGEETEVGKRLLAFFEFGAETLGIDKVIRDLEGPRVYR